MKGLSDSDKRWFYILHEELQTALSVIMGRIIAIEAKLITKEKPKDYDGGKKVSCARCG